MKKKRQDYLRTVRMNPFRDEAEDRCYKNQIDFERNVNHFDVIK